MRSSRQTPLPPLGQCPNFGHFFLLNPSLKRWFSFAQRLNTAKKPLLRSLFNICKKDVRSKTGTNIKETLQLTEKPTFEDMNRNDFNVLDYFPLEEEEEWKREFIEYAMQAREVRILDEEEEELFTSICVN